MNKNTKSWLSAIVVLLVSQVAAWAQNIDVGEMEYLSSCAPCHGRNANGKGPLADQLKAAPIDLTQLAKRNGGVFPMNAVYEKIDGRQEVKAHGTREMPIWGYRYQPFPIGTDQTTNRNLPDPEPMIRGRILSLIDYLNRIQEK
jgi:mono/diheme cytochrome c family protein